MNNILRRKTLQNFLKQYVWNLWGKNVLGFFFKAKVQWVKALLDSWWLRSVKVFIDFGDAALDLIDKSSPLRKNQYQPVKRTSATSLPTRDLLPAAILPWKFFPPESVFSTSQFLSGQFFQQEFCWTQSFLRPLILSLWRQFPGQVD